MLKHCVNISELSSDRLLTSYWVGHVGTVRFKQHYKKKDSLLNNPEWMGVMGIRSGAPRQESARKEQEFIAHDIKGLLRLPKMTGGQKPGATFSPV